MVISFNPEYNIGDIVALKLDGEKKMVVDGYKIIAIDNKGNVALLDYSLYDSEAKTYYFTDIDLCLVERVEQEEDK